MGIAAAGLAAVQVYKPSNKNEFRLVYKEGKARHQKSYPATMKVHKALNAMLFIRCTGRAPPHFLCRANGCQLAKAKKDDFEEPDYALLPTMLAPHLFFMLFKRNSHVGVCAEGFAMGRASLWHVAGHPIQAEELVCPPPPTAPSDISSLFRVRKPAAPPKRGRPRKNAGEKG